MLKNNIRKMDLAKSGIGMDIVIISVPNLSEEQFWQNRLEDTKGQILKQGALHIVVQEDWENGAGNGLGSLYAYQKAREKAFVQYKLDLFQKQREGYSIALYHTAGGGKRLYPLTASEYGNKSAAKLPSLVKVKGEDTPLTLLEGVIRQTNIYAPSRRGRFSVFWADQLFIPSNSTDYSSKHHADILVKLVPMPTEEEWSQKELNKYGLLTLNKNSLAQHLDKVDYGTIKQLIHKEKVSISGGVGLSLGSFSLSTPFTFALMQEFQPELIQKNCSMNSDPYFWMPLTLDQSTYIEMVVKKGIDVDTAKNHHIRMQYFKNHFTNKHGNGNLFGIVDIGVGSFWWDFGSIDNYFNNLIKITKNSVEGYLLRDFFRLEQNYESTLLLSDVGKGVIKSSVVIDSHAEELNIENCVVIGSSLNKVDSANSLFYNVLEVTPIPFANGTVRADVYLSSEDKYIKIFGTRTQDAKNLWETKLPLNTESYESLSQKLVKEDIPKGRALFNEMKEGSFAKI